jgi:hypothetical protein
MAPIAASRCGHIWARFEALLQAELVAAQEAAR